MEYTTVLPLKFTAGASDSFYYPVVLKDKRGLVLIDCGFPGDLPKIEQAMAQSGFDANDLKKVIITHHDHDHMGSLRELTEKYPEVEVYCSIEQASYVTGKKKSLRLIQAEERQKHLKTEAEKLAGKKFMAAVSSSNPVDLVITVKDGDKFPLCGGIEIVDTSGHMPGHICIYVKEDKALIAGDAMTASNGKLCIANPQFTLDKPMAYKSLEKLLAYDIETIICYHGGIVSGDIKARLEQLLKDRM